MTDKTADREIVVTRLIDAPRDLVFSAFTELEHTQNWWVPQGTVTHEWEAKPGGQWRYSQPGPNDTQYPFKITFIEISRPERFVYDFETDADDAPEPVRTTVDFADENGQTRVTLQLQFASAAERAQAAQYGAEKGAKRAMDSLADYAEGLAA